MHHLVRLLIPLSLAGCVSYGSFLGTYEVTYEGTYAADGDAAPLTEAPTEASLQILTSSDADLRADLTLGDAADGSCTFFFALQAFQAVGDPDDQLCEWTAATGAAQSDTVSLTLDRVDDTLTLSLVGLFEARTEDGVPFEGALDGAWVAPAP